MDKGGHEGRGGRRGGRRGRKKVRGGGVAYECKIWCWIVCIRGIPDVGGQSSMPTSSGETQTNVSCSFSSSICA